MDTARQVHAYQQAFMYPVLCYSQNMFTQGVCCQIMSLPTSALSIQLNHTGAAGGAYPPIVFAHMVRDERTALGVAENAAMLRDQVSLAVSSSNTMCLSSFYTHTSISQCYIAVRQSGRWLQGRNLTKSPSVYAKYILRQ